MPAANRQKYTCSQCNREFAAPPFAKLVATFSCYDDDDNLMGEDVADDEPAFVCSPECRKNLTEEFAVACVATFEEHKKKGTVIARAVGKITDIERDKKRRVFGLSS